MRTQRTCACGCGQSLEHLRSDARWAGDAHRKRYARREADPAQRFWNAYVRVQRPARSDEARTGGLS